MSISFGGTGGSGGGGTTNVTVNEYEANFRGDWVSGNSYDTGDIAHHSDASWGSLEDSNTEEPSETSTKWALVNEDGEDGTDGIGVKGDKGDPGDAGFPPPPPLGDRYIAVNSGKSFTDSIFLGGNTYTTRDTDLAFPTGLSGDVYLGIAQDQDLDDLQVIRIGGINQIGAFNKSGSTLSIAGKQTEYWVSTRAAHGSLFSGRRLELV